MVTKKQECQFDLQGLIDKMDDYYCGFGDDKELLKDVNRFRKILKKDLKNGI